MINGLRRESVSGMDEQTTILIVDDDPDIREILGGTMQGEGYRLVFAGNGLIALQKAAEYHPDLILLDVMMPVMDGYETCRRLRADPALSEIPILIITAFSDQVSRLKGIEAGADDFIAKPFDRIEIRARVKTITRLNRYRRLMTERARFVWAVEQSSDGYLNVDESGHILYANPKARLMFNLPPDSEALNQVQFIEQARRFYTLMPPSAWEVWPELLDPELPMYLIRPQDEQSQAVWFQVYQLDLPWQAENTPLLRIAEVTTSVAFSQEVWSFHAAVSHKFNTPLSTIMLASGLVRFFGERLDTPELVEYANAIEQGARRLEGEVNDIIAYISAPSLVSSAAALPIQNLTGMITQAAAELKLPEVRFAPIPGGLCDQKMRLPERAMQIILWEVLENARKFHPSNSPSVEICLSQLQPGRAQLTITDDGVSLPPEQLARATIPYYQAEKVFTGETAGMGLGLPMVTSLLWAAGGDVRLRNRADGLGVRVEIDLPLA